MKLSPEMQAGGMPPVWSTYVTVVDVDAAAAQAKDLGGAILSPPMDVMDAGRMAVIADPTARCSACGSRRRPSARSW